MCATDSTTTAPRVSIIVVSYNTREITLACLASIYEQTQVSFELIVVDNNSTDGSAAAIAKEFPDALLFAETTNHWFAGGCNLGASQASGDYILHLNPDTVVLDGAIDRLIEFAQATPDARIWGGRTFYPDMSPDPASCWGQMSTWNLLCRASGLTGIFPKTTLFNSEAYGGWDRTTEQAVDIVSGCFLLIARPDWDALGGFDEIFLMYGEEADLCLRARNLLSAAPRITPTARIIHYGGASDNSHADKHIRLLRAKAELIKRHSPAPLRPVHLILHAAWPLSRKWATKFIKPARSAIWAEVWARRAEWRSGLTQAPPA